MNARSPWMPIGESRLADTLTRFAPWVAAVIVAIPVLAYRYPPMFDLPCHEEIVAAMRYANDPSRYPAGLMQWNVGHANQLFYFLAWGISYVVPVDLACKLVVAASVAGAPLAAARLADYLGTTRAAAVLVAPLAVGFVFTFGFVGNVLGFAMFLAVLPALDRFARDPTPARTAGAVALLLTLYAAHEIALVLGAVAIVVLSLSRLASVAKPLRIRPALSRLAPLVLTALGLLVEHPATLRERSPTLQHLPTIIDVAAWQKLEQVPEALLGRHGDVTTRPSFFVLFGVIALLGFGRYRTRNGDPAKGASPGWRAALDRQRFTLLGASCLVLYFVFPFSITGAMWLHARFLAPGVAILAVALAPARLPWAACFVPFVAVAAQLALLRPELEATSAVYRDLDPLLARIEPGSAIAAVDPVGGPLRNLVFSVGGAAARAGAERGGRMAASFTQKTPIAPSVIAREHRWDDALLRMAHDGLGLRPASDLHRFRYVLAWTYPTQAGAITRALAPEARLIATSGGWLLYESTLPLASLLSDEPVTTNGESVGDRVRAMSGAAP